MAWIRWSGHADPAEQRLAGLLLVALVVVGRDEPLVAPPDVDVLPVDRLAHRLRGQPGDVLEDGDADPAPGQHDRRRAVHRLGGGQPGDQRLRRRPGQVLGVGLDDDVRAGGVRRRAAARVAGGAGGSRVALSRRRASSAGEPLPCSSAGSNQTCSRLGERSARPVDAGRRLERVAVGLVGSSRRSSSLSRSPSAPLGQRRGGIGPEGLAR